MKTRVSLRRWFRAALYRLTPRESVLYYFAESPFYDRASNNAVVITQASATNPDAISTRQGFEAEISKLSGIEFRVIDSHSRYGPDIVNQGRWTIRKQYREKRSQGLTDKVTVLATYYVIGDIICLASSIGDGLRSKVMDSMQKMDKFVQKASTLSHYTPSRGHEYIKQPAKDADRSRADSAIASRVSTPALGQEDVVMSGSQDSGDALKGATATSNPSIADSRALLDAFQIFARHGNEYMDDVELVGEPGDFSFRRTEVPRSQAPKPAQSQPTPSTLDTPQTSQEAKDAESPKVKVEPSAKPSSAAPAPRLKPKRKKSKAPGSASTPLPNATSPLSP